MMASVCERTTGAAPVAASAAVAVVGYWVWWRWSESVRVRKFVRGPSSSGGLNRSLPSPMGTLPRWCGIIGGHTLSVEPKKAVAQFEGWADEFGGDYELQLVGVRVICVTGLSDIHRILTQRANFKRGLQLDQWNWATAQIGLKDSMLFQEGKAWGRSRRLISPTLNGHSLTAMLPLMSKIGERFCAMLGDHADTGEVVKANSSFARLTHDIIALVALGLDVDSLRTTAERPCISFDAMHSIMTGLDRLIKQPLSMLGWKCLPILPWVRKTKEDTRHLTTVIQGAIDAVRLQANAVGTAAERNVGGGGTTLRKIIKATKANTISDRMLISDREVVEQAAFLFLAGTETTSLTLCWAMYYLSKNPEALLRCRAEALKAAPSSDGMVSTREQLSQLEFCSAVFKETLRLKPPAPVHPLNCTGDFTMKDGLVLKKGTGLLLLCRWVGVSEEFFTRGKEFVPERWIDAERDEALLGENRKGSVIAHEAEAFLALGHGPRICPGQGMGNAEGAIIIAAICARFDISMAPGQADPPEEVTMFNQSLKDFDMVLTRRDQPINAGEEERKKIARDSSQTPSDPSSDRSGVPRGGTPVPAAALHPFTESSGCVSAQNQALLHEKRG